MLNNRGLGGDHFNRSKSSNFKQTCLDHFDRLSIRNAESLQQTYQQWRSVYTYVCHRHWLPAGWQVPPVCRTEVGHTSLPSIVSDQRRSKTSNAQQRHGTALTWSHCCWLADQSAYINTYTDTWDIIACDYNECILFQNLTNLDRSERNAPRSQSKSDLLRHIWENLA